MLALRRYLPLFAAGLLAGCHHANDPAPPSQVVGITGQVLVFDQQANQQPLPSGNVTVTVLGTSPLVSATTNAAGQFVVPHLPAGTYALEFSRPGLSAFYLRGIAHPNPDLATGLPDTYLLYAEPDVQATGLRLGPASGGQVEVAVDLRTPQPTDLFRYALYVGTSPAVSFATDPLVQLVATGGSQPATTATGGLPLTRADLRQAGISAAPGTTLYAVAYGTGLYSMSYRDPATGQQLTWPSNHHQPSPVVPFQMP